MAKLNLTLTEALDLAKDHIVESEDGAKWIKIDSLRELETSAAQEERAAQMGPRARTFDGAKFLASQDPELQEAFADRPPSVGPTPSAARA
jgi:hypothetical protein